MLSSSLSLLTGHSRVDMRVQSEDGTTPLIDAVQSNQLESCKLLLKYGGKFTLLCLRQNLFHCPFLNYKHTQSDLSL